MKTKKRFTLIELLVVIAVIAMLLAVIVPSLKLAKQKAASIDGYEKIADFVKAGGNAILLDNRQAVVKLLPDTVSGYKQYRHEIVTINAVESCVFEGIEPLDISGLVTEEMFLMLRMDATPLTGSVRM